MEIKEIKTCIAHERPDKGRQVKGYEKLGIFSEFSEDEDPHGFGRSVYSGSDSVFCAEQLFHEDGGREDL